MKFVLTTIVMIASVVAMADIPRPRPAVDPRLSKPVNAEAINALVYGVSTAKMTELKAGTNAMVVEQQNINPNTTMFTFTTRNCIGMKGCIESKQISVTRTEMVRPDRRSVTYKSSEIRRLRGM